LPGIPDGLLIGAPVDLAPAIPGELKVLSLCDRVAQEALDDAQLDWKSIPSDRFGCAVSAHMGDARWSVEQAGMTHLYPPSEVPWWHQWLPNTACSRIANRYRLNGPRLCHSTACASGLIEVLGAVRAIEDHQCDIALAGSAEGFDPLFAAGFHQMRVLAYHDDPQQACRPFDLARQGFVMGEGAAMFVLERLSHALDRGANIYAEVAGGKLLAAAHHMTGLDLESDSLAYLISETLRIGRIAPKSIGYINAHGTGTLQNDVAETRAIRRAMGSAADTLCVSATKSILGHLINAAGSVELAITALAMRDGFVPPTLNLTRPDPLCDLDCIPLVGRNNAFVCALKLSVAFGGALAAVALRRWENAVTPATARRRVA
ncbi:MAG TPA: beta-ketoacyl-[acyl-carrier-protein] synthase family protein, partial [Pirellulales bacterium]|nr:beta-ketoacyl-[acyl-carrier-protein] synthase family protein [Pirellulales bacterium]